MSIKWDLDWHGERVGFLVEESAFKGLQQGAEHLLQVSRTRVPIEEGTLERSGVASADRATLTAAVSYGGSGKTKDYAVVQHERLDFRHAEGRTAKYLEAPANEEREVIGEIIAAAIRRRIGT